MEPDNGVLLRDKNKILLCPLDPVPVPGLLSPKVAGLIERQ
jgi:hypothetical protein